MEGYALMDFTLRQLQVFAAVIEAGSMRGAAVKLGLSQPAVSMIVADLEQNFRCRLFDRWGKKIILNNRGKELLPLARRMLAEAQEIESIFNPDDARGFLWLGASSTLATYLIPLIIPGFLINHPGTNIRLISSNKKNVIDQLEQFGLDIGLIAGSCDSPDIEKHYLFDDELTIFCAKDHPLAKKSNISISDLKEAQWILRESGSWTRELLVSSLDKKVAGLSVILELNNSEAIKRIVQQGNTISCLSRLAVQNELDSGDLTSLKVPFLDLTRAFHLLIHRRKYRSSLINEFVNHCHQRVRYYRETGVW